MPLTQDRDTKSKPGVDYSAPAAAGILVHAGALLVLDASGNATPGETATTLTAAGRAKDRVDNTGGAAGDEQVPYDKGVFHYKNSAAADEITRAEIGDDCYIVDDETVAKTDGTGTRSIAGKIDEIDANGVWVKIS